MAISFSVDCIDFDLQQKTKVKKWISETIKTYGKRVGDIGYLFSSDQNVLAANIQYLQHDTFTDIITFDYVEGDVISGDILISIDRVRDNAEKFSVTFDQELRRVIIHGIHHLLGQADKSDEDAAEMRRRENDSLLLWETI